MLSPEESVRYMGQLNMDQHGHGRNMKVLRGLVLLALAYRSLLYYLPTLTGANLLDGSLGLLLRLYICSHPAKCFSWREK